MDTLSPAQRSENMRRIRSRDTIPEIEVRKLVCALGYSGYRLHRKDLPGKPDIAWIGRQTAIFVHGCFWHGHACPEGVRKPKSNVKYWLPKIERNRQRDAMNIRKLRRQGWHVLVVWECELGAPEKAKRRIETFLYINIHKYKHTNC